jgi:hypothetical protein
MREIRKQGHTWQIRTDGGEWLEDFEEPNIAILQPDWDGTGFYWSDLELKDAGVKGMGVFAARDIPKGTEIPILGLPLEETYCTSLHNIAYFDRSRPGTGYRGCIDGDPAIDPHKGVGYFGLATVMMFNESGRPNCVFRESNYVQLVRDVKKGQELTVYYGNSRDMVKIRKQQGYTISHDPNTILKPKEVGTSAQRVENWRHWMGLILLKKKDKTEDITEGIMIHITETANNKQPGNGVVVTFRPPVKKGVIYQIINMKIGVLLRTPTVYHFTEAWTLGGKSKTFHDYLTVKPSVRTGQGSNVIEITTWYDAKALDKIFLSGRPSKF